MDDYSAGGLLIFDVLLNLLSVFIYAGVYLLVSFASLALFRKVGIADWKAWVPVVREWEMFRLAGMAVWWAVVLPAGSVVVGVLCSIALVVAVIAAIERGMAGAVGESIAFGVGGVLFFGALLLAWCVFSLIIMIKMMNRVNQGFGQSLVMTLLGVVCYPAWLAVLGWGSAQWLAGASNVAVSRLRFPDGSEVVLRANRVVVGSSSVSDGLPSATQLVTVRDSTHSVAPFHVQLDREGTSWRITDLHTAAGTYVVDATGQTFRLAHPVSGVTTLMLGNVRVDLSA